MKKLFVILTSIIISASSVAYGESTEIVNSIEFNHNRSQTSKKDYDPTIVSPENYDEWIGNGWKDCGEIWGYSSCGYKTKVHMFYKNRTFIIVCGRARGEVRKLSTEEQYPFRYTDYPIKHTKFSRTAPLQTGSILWETIYFK